jgi:ABC-2 type transport system ATP-binding protein
MIRLERLTKAFGGRPALESLTLEVAAGEVFGLLGHNGAGKSTTFGLILGQLRPTAGEAFVRGVSVQRERGRALQRVGAIFEAPAFYDYLSGWRNLCMLAALSGPVSRAEMEETVRYVGLEERIHALVRVYSHGMRQRLALAQALLPRPDLVLLDEPAEGLDPEGIREMRELILRLNRERGMTVILSSHLLAEVELTCDRVAILNRGRLVFQGHWQELASDRVRYRLEVDDSSRAAEVIGRAGGQLDRDQVASLPRGTDVAALVDGLVAAGVRLRRLEPVRQSLEEIYLRTIADIKPPTSHDA